jgi:formamidopyrimidine-DNA glycosylase
MPELPEVQTIVREMNESSLIGKKIKKVEVFWPRSLSKTDPETFCKQLTNQSIKSIDRRGKYLVFKLTDYTLFVHLRMTGKFLFTNKNDDSFHSHERIRLHLSDGRILRYEDQRKFGKWTLATDPEEILGNIGIEPLSPEFTLKTFQDIIKSHKRRAKAFLLDQRYIAGLGNIYVDEALWDAKIHPLRDVSTLSNSEVKALYEAIPKVLQRGVDNIGTSLGAQRANYFSLSGKRGGNQYQLKVFRRDGELCSRCHTKIVRIVVAQRGTHICPHCQQMN